MCNALPNRLILNWLSRYPCILCMTCFRSELPARCTARPGWLTPWNVMSSNAFSERAVSIVNPKKKATYLAFTGKATRRFVLALPFSVCLVSFV